MRWITGKLITITPIVFFTSFTGINRQAQIKSAFSFKDQVLKQINTARAKGCHCGLIYMPPVAPVAWNNLLAEAAASHASDMANQKYFSHQSKNGDQPHDRLEKFGYTAAGLQRYVIGENIAAGQTSIEQVSQDWLKSEDHCKNLMNPAFKEVGVYVYNNYWVEDFGGRYPFDITPSRSK